jgi:hypothetical protein
LTLILHETTEVCYESISLLASTRRTDAFRRIGTSPMNQSTLLNKVGSLESPGVGDTPALVESPVLAALEWLL